jgi:hypothetical protein
MVESAKPFGAQLLKKETNGIKQSKKGLNGTIIIQYL